MTTIAEFAAKIEIGDADLDRLHSAVNDAPGNFVNATGVSVPNLRKRLEDVGYRNPVPFASGLTVYDGSFTVTYLGNTYAADSADTPFVTTGTFNPAQWVRPVFLDEAEALVGSVTKAFSAQNGAVLMAAIGDSLAARTYYNNTAASPLHRNGAGPLNWARATSNGLFDNPPDLNFAQGGSTTLTITSTQMTPLLAAIASAGVRFVFISVGTNDANSGATLDSIETRLLDIATQIVEAGATPIFMTPPPRVIPSGVVAAFNARHGSIVGYIANHLPLLVPGVVVIGGWHGIFDPATNQPYGGVTPTADRPMVDGTHLSPRSAAHIAKQLVDYMRTRTVGRPSTPFNGLHVYDETNNRFGPIINPVFSATTAYPGGDANISGVVPTGWAVERSGGNGLAACSLATPTVDGLVVNAFRLALTLPSGSAGPIIAYSQITCPNGLANKKLKLRMRVRVTGAVNLRYVELRNRVDTSPSVSTFDMFRVEDGGVTFLWPDGSYDLTLDATSITLPTVTAGLVLRAQLSMSVAVGGSATVDILSTEWVVVP